MSREKTGKAVARVMHATVRRCGFLRYARLAGAIILIGGLTGLFVACDGSPSAGTDATTPAIALATTTTIGVARPVTTESQTSTSSPATTDNQHTTNPKGKVAYLTFDDGPSRVTPELLKILDANHVPATFFVIGQLAEEYPGILKKIASYGNVIGVHSWTHDYSYIYKNTHNFLADFNKLKDYIYQETGVTPNVCRFPGGTNNTVCFKYSYGHIMKDLVALVEDMGFKYYDWNVSSAEASSPPPSKERIVSNVVSGCKNKETAVILFHDAAIQGYLDAVPVVIDKLRSMGFMFDTLSPDNPPKSRSAGVQFPPS